MFSYFRLDSFDPHHSRIFLCDLHGEDGAWLHIDEPGDLFALLEDHHTVVVAARTDAEQSWRVRLRDLRFHSMPDDETDQLGACFCHLPRYAGTATKPRFDRFIHEVPRTRRVDHHRTAALPPEPAVASEAIAEPKPTQATVVPIAPARSQPLVPASEPPRGWTGFLRRVGLHR